MTPELKTKYDLVDDRLGKSKILQRFGYASRRRVEIDQTDYLPACTDFKIATGKHRCLTIGSCYHDSTTLSLTLEISHTKLNECFLLENWSRPLRDPNAPYPLISTSYFGDFDEKLDQMINFVDELLSVDAINEFLKGESWSKIASLL